MKRDDIRLIERGFPCHQVGAETQRERGAVSVMPPVYYLHVWWARRPLIPSRAAIIVSLDRADTDPEQFVRQLGIERVQALVNGEPWTLTGDLLERIERRGGKEVLPVDAKVLRALENEEERRAENRDLIQQMKAKDARLATDPVLRRWEADSRPIPKPWPKEGQVLGVQRVMGDPAWAKERIAWETENGIRTSEDKYGYERAFNSSPSLNSSGLTVFDPTAGGGSIPFEALRLGHRVIANELNPVATTILYATLDYPARFGVELVDDIDRWGQELRQQMVSQMEDLFPNSSLPAQELDRLESHLKKCPELVSQYSHEQLDGFIYARQVTCPHCGGEAPLLNTCWLSKEAGDPWGVRVVTDRRSRNGKVRFETYQVVKGKGPNGEDPDAWTVKDGDGQCIHCRQAIDGDEIKRQARGESPHGKWKDRLYAVVAVRYEPVLDKRGKPVRYASGDRKGEIKTRKVRFFRPPNERDLKALEAAEKRLKEKWPEWEAKGLIPTERVPEGNDMRPIYYGMPRWCDMFTPRQLLGHVTLVEGLNRLKPEIMKELGPNRGKAVVTYLQFAIDKGLDYNSRQTTWHPGRGIIGHAFVRHDFALKWMFGEMIFTGPNSGAMWGLSQVVKAYKEIAILLEPVYKQYKGKYLPLTILNGTAAYMPQVETKSVDLVCMDPPYYDNVQYGELSDYFYHWQRRTLKDLYPGLFNRSLGVNTRDEAVANPVRDGSRTKAKETYERMMGEIFAECRRVLRDNGIMTLMFTHKSLDAWETLTKALIENGWAITASMPIESEAGFSMNQIDQAAAASSIFIACRKREVEQPFPASWTGFGGQGVQHKIRDAVREGLKAFAPLRLNPVDEMVACYGRALHVLSEQWPVMDGDEPVGPIRAMNEASRVVAESQIERITKGRLSVDDLDPETAMALTIYGVWGLGEVAYDEALNLSRSLNIHLEGKPAGYNVNGRMIGINQEAGGRRGRARRASVEDVGYHAPLVRSGSKLRLTAPEERNPKRLERPQTDWDALHGLIVAYREGDVPVARAYLEAHAEDRKQRILDLVSVWGTEAADKDMKQEAEAILFGLR